MHRRAALSVSWTRAKLVRLADGFGIPSRYTVEINDPGLPYLVTMEVAVEGGQPTCQSLVAERREGGSPVTQEGLRQLPIARFLRHSAAEAALAVTGRKGSWKLTPLATDRERRAFYKALRGSETRGRGRRPLDDDELRDVANVYRAARALGEPPTIAVAQARQVSRSHAGRLVMIARRRGFLGKTRPGRAGEG